MSTLIVLGYPSEAEAKSAYQKILDLDKNLIVSLQSVAVVARRATASRRGDARLQGGNLRGVGSVLGRAARSVVLRAHRRRGAGAGIGALTGAIVKHGVDKDFQDRVRNLLSTDDSAAVFMVVDEMTTDKFIDAIRPFGGDVLQTSLSIKDEEELKHELSRTSFRPPEGIAPVGPEALPSCESEDGRAFGRMRDASRVFRAFPSFSQAFDQAKDGRSALFRCDGTRTGDNYPDALLRREKRGAHYGG